jgi:hypothetical protein
MGQLFGWEPDGSVDQLPMRRSGAIIPIARARMTSLLGKAAAPGSNDKERAADSTDNDTINKKERLPRRTAAL